MIRHSVFRRDPRLPSGPEERIGASRRGGFEAWGEGAIAELEAEAGDGAIADDEADELID